MSRSLALILGGCSFALLVLGWVSVGRPGLAGLGTRAHLYGETLLLALPSFHALPSPSGLVALRPGQPPAPLPTPTHSPVDMRADSRGRVWVLDSGVVSTLERPLRLAPPKVIAIDPETHSVLKTIDLGNLTSVHSRPHALALHEDRRGNLKKLYISDSTGRAILVWDMIRQRGHRVLLPRHIVPPKPDVLDTALLYGPDRRKRLYFSFFSTPSMFYIEAKGLEKGGRGNVVEVGKKPPGMVFLGSISMRKLYFRHSGKNDVHSWDSMERFIPRNFVRAGFGRRSMFPVHVVEGPDGKPFCLHADLRGLIQGRKRELLRTTTLAPLTNNDVQDPEEMETYGTTMKPTQPFQLETNEPNQFESTTPSPPNFFKHYTTEAPSTMPPFHGVCPRAPPCFHDGPFGFGPFMGFRQKSIDKKDENNSSSAPPSNFSTTTPPPTERLVNEEENQAPEFTTIPPPVPDMSTSPPQNLEQ